MEITINFTCNLPIINSICHCHPSPKRNYINNDNGTAGFSWNHLTAPIPSFLDLPKSKSLFKSLLPKSPINFSTMARISVLLLLALPFLSVSAHFELVPGWPDPSIAAKPVYGSGLTLDADRNLLVLHRGGIMIPGYPANTTIPEDVLLVVDAASGKVLRSWGRDMFYWPHGIEITPSGDIFITDSRLHQVFKVSILCSRQNQRHLLTNFISFSLPTIPPRNCGTLRQSSRLASDSLAGRIKHIFALRQMSLFPEMVLSTLLMATATVASLNLIGMGDFSSNFPQDLIPCFLRPLLILRMASQ